MPAPPQSTQKCGGVAAAVAFASLAIVLTDGSVAAASAFASSAAVLTDGGAVTALAVSSSSTVLADARSPRILGTGPFGG